MEQERRLLQPVHWGQHASHGKQAHPYAPHQISARVQLRIIYNKFYWAPSRVDHWEQVRRYLSDYDDLPRDAYRDSSPESDPGIVTDRSVILSSTGHSDSGEDIELTGIAKLSDSSSQQGGEQDVSEGHGRETSVKV